MYLLPQPSRLLRTGWLCLMIAASVGAPARAHDLGVAAYARSILVQIQPMSLHQSRQYCGTIGLTRSGLLTSSTVSMGDSQDCAPPAPPEAATVIASFQTYGGYAPGVNRELPSVKDVRANVSSGQDSYISTPGGRFWYVNGKQGVAQQICGIGCLPRARDFVAGEWGKIRKSYTLEQLVEVYASF